MGDAPGAQRPLPEQFGRYRILKKLGAGGMGAVYLAHDTQLDRQVALKVPSFTPKDNQVRQRFYREAKAAATLDHPNLCPVYDVGEIDGILYLTMAFIEGKPLSAFLHGGKALPQGPAALLVYKLAGALQEAHQKGVIHRDLKPANVMINQRREPVVMDFGLAREVETGSPGQTTPGTVLGTPSYMPPEQARGDVTAVGPGSDVYSLGVILFEMLTGRKPYRAENPMAIVYKHRKEPIPQLPAQFEVVQPLLERLLAKTPADRIATAEEAAEALQHTLDAWLARGISG